MPFARQVNARPGPRVELQIVEPAENTLPSKMQKFWTSVPVIWKVVVCAAPGAGIAAIADNATPTVHLRIESLNVGARDHSRTNREPLGGAGRSLASCFPIYGMKPSDRPFRSTSVATAKAPRKRGDQDKLPQRRRRGSETHCSMITAVTSTW